MVLSKALPHAAPATAITYAIESFRSPFPQKRDDAKILLNLQVSHYPATLVQVFQLGVDADKTNLRIFYYFLWT